MVDYLVVMMADYLVENLVENLVVMMVVNLMEVKMLLNSVYRLWMSYLLQEHHHMMGLK